MNQKGLADLVKDALSRIDESDSANDASAFSADDDFEVAFQVALDGHHVVARGENTPAPGAKDGRPFDAWADGVRSDFKLVRGNADRINDHLKSANAQGVDSVYILVLNSNITQREAMNKVNGWLTNPYRGTVNFSQVHLIGDGYRTTINTR
ncbi:hypothetical protein ACFU7Y_33360 [Kitasatospora sp. NPDC057542]|uniref:hypothetical protein n=1 Tax=Kitasatospora sp. NPDC057542 TaxID=3346162 RepID=UPI0036AA9D99